MDTTTKIVLGVLAGVVLAALLLVALARRGGRKSTGITGKNLHRWFRRHS